MSNELKVKEEKKVVYQSNGEEIILSQDIIQKHLTRGNETVTVQEVVLFTSLCKYNQLNPFLNEAYLVKFKGAPAKMIVSKEAFMKRAERSPEYEGFKAGLIVERKGEILELEGAFSLNTDILLGGWCEVFRKDRKHSTTIKVELEEYSKEQSTWNKMKKTMIRKVAIVQGMREAFPDNASGMYIEDEMPEIKKEKTVSYEIAEKANKEIIDIEHDEETGEIIDEKVSVSEISEDEKKRIAEQEKAEADSDDAF